MTNSSSNIKCAPTILNAITEISSHLINFVKFVLRTTSLDTTEDATILENIITKLRKIKQKCQIVRISI